MNHLATDEQLTHSPVKRSVQIDEWSMEKGSNALNQDSVTNL